MKPQARSARRSWKLAAQIVVAGAIALAALRSLPNHAQDELELSESYRLEDTWSSGGIGAPATVLQPRGIDLDRGEIWLVDSGNHRVQAFSADRAFLRTIGRPGTGDELGELDQPHDVAVAGDLVYVTDRGAGHIAVFTREGEARDQWSLPVGTIPWGIAATGSLVYVTDPDAGEVLVLEDGTVTSRWEGFLQPLGLDVAPDGRVHVADKAAGAVITMSPEGAEVGRLAVNHRPRDVAVDERGDRYVLAEVAGSKGDHGVILWYKAGETRSERALFLHGFQALAVSATHGIYATIERQDPLFHGVQRYQWRPQDGLPPPSGRWDMLGFPMGRLQRPVAITAVVDGRLWLADEWPRIQGFDAQGQAVAQASLPGSPVDIGGLTEGLIVAELSRLAYVGTDLVLSRTLRLTGGGQEDWVTGLAVHPDGQRFSVLDGAGSRVRLFGLTDTLRSLGSFALPTTVDGAWELYWDVAVSEASVHGHGATGEPLWIVANRSGYTIDLLAGQPPAVVQSWAVDGIPTRVAIGPDGAVFVLTSDGVVWKYGQRGELLAGWYAGAFSAGLSEIADLTVDDAGRVYTVDRLANAVHVWAPNLDGTTDGPLVRGGGCRLRAEKNAAPDTLLLGASVTVELVIGGDCPNTLPRADIVLAIDRSGSMNNNNGITATKEAALAFLDRLNLAEDRIALVAFNNNATLVQQLTDDSTSARQAIDGLSAIGGTDIAAAIRLSAAELFGERGRADAKPVLVLMTDGKPNRATDETLTAAREARRQGAQIFTIGFGDVDPMVMALAASTPEDAYFAADPATLVAIYAEIADRLTADVLARTIDIVDELPPSIRYVGPVDGPPAIVSGQVLRWSLSNLPFTGIRLAYEIQPTDRGLQPTNVDASATFVDGLRQAGRLRFPVPMIDVVDVVPSPTPTFTPVPTPTPIPIPLYLPIAVTQSCDTTEVGTDVVIVLDISGSMAARVSDGGLTQLESAIAAAELLVARMRSGDRAAIVSFHDLAELVQPLTADTALLRQRLRALVTASGTRIDRGLEEAWRELSSERAITGNTLAVVLLTDGRSSVEDAVIVASSDAVKALSARLFVIGLGHPDELDMDLLRQVASSTNDAFEAPSAAELLAIYASIAKTIECANLTWP